MTIESSGRPRRRRRSESAVAAPERDDSAAAVALPYPPDAPAPGPAATSSDVAPSAAAPDDLRAVPLFQSLSDANLGSLAETVAKRCAVVGDVLCQEGEHGEEMYV